MTGRVNRVVKMQVTKNKAWGEKLCQVEALFLGSPKVRALHLPRSWVWDRDGLGLELEPGPVLTHKQTHFEHRRGIRKLSITLIMIERNLIYDQLRLVSTN